MIVVTEKASTELNAVLMWLTAGTRFLKVPGQNGVARNDTQFSCNLCKHVVTGSYESRAHGKLHCESVGISIETSNWLRSLE